MATESGVTCYTVMENNTQINKTEKGKPCMYQIEKQNKMRQREGKRPICYSNGGLPHMEWQVSVVHEHIVRDVHLQLQIGTSSSLIPGFSTEVPFVY